MRKLSFIGEQARKRYEILYDGLMVTRRHLSVPSETRTMGKVLDKLEAVGEPTIRGTLQTFSLKGEGDVNLTEQEYNLFRECIEGAPWAVRGSRDVTATVEWFLEAPSMAPPEHEGM